MKDWHGQTAMITGAASGIGLESCRVAAGRGMNVVMADVQDTALDAAARDIEQTGVAVLPFRLDVAKCEQVEAMAAATVQRFGVPHVVFNNAGVSAGGLVWENSSSDWEWVLGVNLMGVVHGVRVFTPLMLAAAASDRTYRGHVLNTASMAGLVNPPNMGIYNVGKHAVVSLSETLYQDLALVTEQVHAHVLCPFFVPTAIHQSARNRPADLSEDTRAVTKSQMIHKANGEKAVGHGKVTAAMVAQFAFDAIDADRFYVYSHPQSLGSVRARLEDIAAGRNPGDPFLDRPDIGDKLREDLRRR